MADDLQVIETMAVRNTRKLIYMAAVGVLFVAVPRSRGPMAQSNRAGERSSSSVTHGVVPQVAAKYKIPGLAVAVIQQGQLRGIEVFGLRDVKTNAPVTPRTVFEAGPLGEPLYTYAVLRLAAEGHFNAGSPLTSLLPLPYVRDLDPTSSSNPTESLYDPRFNQITALRIMDHTSGMPNWARNQHLHLQFSPGQKWSYSNEGYVYLQKVVEHVTGEAFDEFLARSVLRPARMAHTSFTWQDGHAAEIATGYDISGTPVEIHRYSRPAAAATLYTTIQDYAQFLAMLLASAPAQAAHESAVSLMINPTVVVDAATQFSWGLGVGLEKSGDDLFFFHRENSSGFQCFFMASRKTGSGVVIFTNSGNGLDAVPEILAATIGGNHPVLTSEFLRSR